MSGFEEFVTRAKRFVENFIRNPNKDNLHAAEEELQKYNGIQMQIFQVRLLTPLMLKLDKINGENIELQAGIIRLMKTVISQTYIKDVKAVKTLLLILIKQIRDCEKAAMKPHLSEEIKLATMECIAEIFIRSTSDVLEQYHTIESALFIGQILLSAVEFISSERYKKLVIASINCLMAVFYVHDKADPMDIVLRNQVADTIFIFVPKIFTVLFKTAISDVKLGETLISTALKALGRILLIMFDKGDRGSLPHYDKKAFIELVTKCNESESTDKHEKVANNPKHSKKDLEEQLNKLQSEKRSSHWFSETASKLTKLIPQISILRANQSTRIRFEYARLCCQLMERCSSRLGDNNVEFLESILAMSQDEDETIRRQCVQTLQTLQRSDCAFIVEDLVDVLFDKHLVRLPRVIHRCDNEEQYAEFQFLKGFFENISDRRLKTLLTFSKNLEEFCLCLILAFELKMGPELLVDEYALRDICENDNILHTKMWRKLKNIDSPRVFDVLCDICKTLGRSEICDMVFDHLMDSLNASDVVVNEITLICVYMVTSKRGIENKTVVQSFLKELIDERHWHLALQPDEMRRLKLEKKSDWYVDRTPGLYESAIEIRVQDRNFDDSDDDDERGNAVSFADAQLNVLHTCIILDALGRVAIALGSDFRPFIFQTIHRVLLKAGSSNYNVYLCGSFALSSMRKALGFCEIHELLEEYTDYISYHMRTILKKSLESQTACDILSVVLQYSSLNTVSHLETIFFVIQEECAKAHQSDNVTSYLKVFHAFFHNIPKWTVHIDKLSESEEETFMQAEYEDPYTQWMNILNKPRNVDVQMDEEVDHIVDQPDSGAPFEDEGKQNVDELEKPVLPRYIKLTKDVIGHIIKFVSSKDKMQQIVALECLISGLPLLREYEDEFLPLVHLTWQAFVQRIREKDPIVLNRCFSLLRVLAVLAKDFLLRRTLNDVIPFLVSFLTNSAKISETESSSAQTQTFKLQSKLLQEFATLIECMEIGGKHLNNISQAVALYLSKKQPSPLQSYAVDYFKQLIPYNGPFIYVVVMKKAHLVDYKDSVEKVLQSFQIKTTTQE